MTHTLEKPASLRGAVVNGLRWKAVGQVTTQLSRFVVTIVLARLLLPRDFGLAGMVLVFGGMIQVFADVGFSASIIQHKVVTEADRSTAFWVNVFVGVILTALGLLAAPFVAAFYGEPTLKPLLMALSLTFLIAALGSTQASLLTREMRFRELELTGSVAAIAGAVVAVAAAFAGAGPWALILQGVVAALTTTASLWLWVRWLPRLVVSRTSLRKLWSFGAGVFGSRVFGFLSRDSDNFLVGRVLGAHALGIYAMAYSVITMPFDRLVVPVVMLVVPMFARLQDDVPRMRDVWLRGMRVCVAVIGPLSIGVVVLAPELVRVVLGERWLPAVRVLQVLAFVGFIQSLTTFTAAVCAARYRTALLFRVTMTAFAAHLCGFVVGLHWGVLGVAIGYAISNVVVAVPLQLVYTARALSASAGEVADAVSGVVTAILAMAVLALGTSLAIGTLGGSAPARLVAAVVVGAVSYVLLLAWRDPRVLDELPLPVRLRLVLRRPPTPAVSTSGDGLGG